MVALNALMFLAESQEPDPFYSASGWHDFLAEMLADDFAIRRSAPEKPREGRDAFLAAAAGATAAKRTIVPASIHVWESESLAVVTCVVEIAGREERFTNTRVFTPGGRYGWRCHWWQVTAANAEGATRKAEQL